MLEELIEDQDVFFIHPSESGKFGILSSGTPGNIHT